MISGKNLFEAEGKKLLEVFSTFPYTYEKSAGWHCKTFNFLP